MNPLISRILVVLDRQGLINMPLKVDGVQVKISPISPLAEAPKMEEVNKVLNFMQIANAMGPAGQMAINVQEAVSFIAEKMGVDQSILNDPQEVEMMMMQQQMMAQQQAQLPGDEQLAEAMQ